jgi:hypothetical protein
MAKMNNTKKTPGMNKALNHEGAVGHKLGNLELLFSKVLGSFFGESTHYEKRDPADEFRKITELIEGVHPRDKEYVLKIAQLGRETSFGKMIQYPIEILVACFNIDMYKGSNFLDPDTRKNKLQFYTDRIVRRALDITEVVSSQIAMYDFSTQKVKTTKGKLNNVRNRVVPLPMQLRKGLEAKLNQLDDFALSKGLAEGKDVSLADVIKLVRPNPTLSKHKNRDKFYKSIIEGTVNFGNGKAQIKSEMSKMGQSKTVESVERVREAVEEGTIQNIVSAIVALYQKGIFNDKQILNRVCDRLRDPKEIHKSKLLPQYFWSAYSALEDAGSNATISQLCEAISDALDLSVANTESLDGYNGILVDVSSSMRQTISSKSTVDGLTMACILGAVAYKKGYGDLFIFGTECQRADFSRKMPIIDIVKTLISCNPKIGGGTNLYNALCCITQFCEDKKTKYDNFLIISDNDCYGYDKSSSTLTLGERRGLWGVNYIPDADKHLNIMFSKGMIKKVWINNLLANETVIANTNEHRKNLIAGFTEQYINIINTYNSIGGNADIRKVIDSLVDKYCK